MARSRLRSTARPRFKFDDTIVAGGSISSSFSGEFDVIPLPEPVTMGLIGAGLVAIAAIKRRRPRKQVADQFSL